MNRSYIALGAGILPVLALTTTSLAVITDVNGMRIQLRRFNDYPNSTLNVTPAPTPPGPALPYPLAPVQNLSLNEGPFGAGGFANNHRIRLSSDAGATAYGLAGTPGQMSTDRLDIRFNVTMSVGSTGPRKEAGFILDTFIAGESQFIITSDGEVAAFGGPFPFFSFGGAGTYVPGNQAQLRIIYSPDNDPVANQGDASTLEYLYDNNVLDATPAVSSGRLEFSNLENGLIAGSDIGMYVQNQPNDSNPNDFSNVALQNIVIALPEPASLGVISLFGVALLGRRRNV